MGFIFAVAFEKQFETWSTNINGQQNWLGGKRLREKEGNWCVCVTFI